MSEYRDYGLLVNIYNGSVTGKTGVATEFTTNGQVYLATHKDNLRLPYMNRSFISFSYGYQEDKEGNKQPVHIENFNLIATIDGDRMNNSGYSSFEDITSKYNVLNGQQYWGTHFNAKELDIHLATDGIELRMLDDFLYWFMPGEAKELILAEHPNRAILARIAEPPQLHLLPFETITNIVVSRFEYPVHTTMYKGEIDIKFVMDEPHWYAKDNLLGKKDGDRYIDVWKDANGQEVDIFASLDALKIIYEDGIPLGSMIQNDMLLGNGAYAMVENLANQLVWDPPEAEIVWTNGEPSGRGARIAGIITEEEYYTVSQRVAGTEGEEALATETGEVIGFDKDLEWQDDYTEILPGEYSGVIAGAIINASGNGIESLSTYNNNDKNVGYFYYSGTAPATTLISFSFTPTIFTSGTNKGYIRAPYNSHTSPKYNTLTIESLNKQELKFTTPNILTSYNNVVEIFKTKVVPGFSWEDIRQSIREEIRHKYVREWAIKIIDDMLKAHDTPQISSQSTMVTNMSYFLQDKSGVFFPMSFIFNSETGEAIGKFKYRIVTLGSVEDWSTYGTILPEYEEEDVGDMLRSNYIIIRDRNYPTETGAIVHWEVNGKTQSHRIYHDVEVPLHNLSIIYKNMYL